MPCRRRPASRLRDGRRRPGHPRQHRGPARRPVRRAAGRPPARCRVRRRGASGPARWRCSPTRPGAARRRRGELPVLVVDDPRAVLGAVAAAVYGDPTRAAAGHRHHRHGRQDLDRLPDRVGPARGRPRHLPDRHGRDPDRRRGASTACAPRPEATDLQALFAAALERGVDRGGDGGVQPRAGLRPGRRQCASRSAGSPTSAWTTSTSTPTWTTTSRPRRSCSTGGAGRGAQPRRSGGAPCCAGPGRSRYSAAGDAAARPGGPADIDRRRLRPAVHRARPGRRARSRPASRLPGRHNVANALLALACLVEVGVDAGDRGGRASAACRGVPGRLELVDAPGPGARRGRLRPQAGRDRGRAGRAAGRLGPAAG